MGRATRRIVPIFLILVVGPIAAQDGPVLEGSLYQRDRDYVPPPSASGPNGSLFADIPIEPKKFDKHDLITILILERSRSRVQAASDTQKELAWELDINEFIRLRSKNDSSQNPFRQFTLEPSLVNTDLGIEMESEYERRNSGRTSRDGQLLEKVTAEVVKVLPNRNLLIEARKTRRINDETEILVLTGVIRSDDVKTDNSIDSEKIARMMIEYRGDGSVNNGQKAGWLARAFEWLYPF